ncbi:MAG: hypothetical protein NT163_02085 [Chlorobiales bacterium]|nr:hypothetical protein [Chlorobiales bacterium]
MTSIMDELRLEAEQPGEIISFPKQNKPNDVHHVHHVHTLESEQKELEKHIMTVESVIERAKVNAGLYACSEFIEAMKFVREHADEEWVRLRVRIKQRKPSGVLLADIDDATRPDSEGSGERNVAAALIKLVVGCGELFYDECSREAFVTISDKNETLKIGGSLFTDWLSYAYYQDSGHSSASEAAIKQASSALSGLCKFEGGKERVFMRAAKHTQSGAYYLFMADDKNRAIEVTATGWRVLDRYPVKFWKPSSSSALPEPVAGGDVGRLWEFCNIPTDDRLLVLAWMLDSFRVDTPFPVLELNGVQGSAKSSTQAKLRSLIDPSTANLRKAPKNDEDVAVAANNNWMVSYENLSYLPARIQDTFCSIATGGAAGGRALYTNGEESVIEMKRPCVINGIPSLITAQDLTERSIHVELPRIEQYLGEVELQTAYDSALPEIFGGLLDLFVTTLSILPSVKIARPPRMVDFCSLGEAMARGLGENAGVFTALYNENRKESVLRSIESSPVASAVLELACTFVAGATVHDGTYSELLDKLLKYKHDNDGWPKNPKGLANALKRNMPALQQAGVVVIPEQGQKRNNKGKQIVIKTGEHGEHGERHFANSTQKEKNVIELVDDKEPF